MQRTAEHAEVRTRAIAANELHARQDTFMEVARPVMTQLEVIAGMLFVSSQGTPGDGVVPDKEVDTMFARLPGRSARPHDPRYPPAGSGFGSPPPSQSSHGTRLPQ